MSFKEIITMRIYRFLRNRIIKPNVKVPKDLSLDLSPLRPEQREFYFAHFSHLPKDLIQVAGLIMQNRIRIFGREIAFSPDLEWNRDFITGKKWPLDIKDYHSSLAGDPKDIWELNRHQFLPVLGKAYFITRDEQYAQKAISFINSWIEQNPPFCGINWSSGVELALRILSWLWTLKYIIGSQPLTQMTRQKIYESLFRQANHISRNLSLHSSANNHLVAELTALTFMGMYFDQDRWKKKAPARLEEEIDHQMLSDGVGAEQSPSYHAHILEYYILIALILKEKGLGIPEKITKGLERGAIFLQSILDKNGYPSQIGDNDSGEILRLSCAYSNFKSLLNLIAHITQEDSVMRKDVSQDEKTFWLIGAESFQSILKEGSGKDKPLRCAFPAGGYYLLKKDYNGTRIGLIFDCGPLGMKPMSGHGHADSLSFILFVEGLPVFIDPGTYTYFKNNFWRNYFRGTSAHNTIRIDGEDQSKFVGEFLALDHAEAKCTEWEEGRKVSGRHNGYVRYHNPAMHKRTISLHDEKSVLRIDDVVETQGSHLLEQFFHLDSRVVLKESGNKRFEIKIREKNVILRMDQSLAVTVYYGDEVIPLGWQSTYYGHKEKTFTVVGRRRIAATTNLVTEIYF